MKHQFVSSTIFYIINLFEFKLEYSLRVLFNYERSVTYCEPGNTLKYIGKKTLHSLIHKYKTLNRKTRNANDN